MAQEQLSLVLRHIRTLIGLRAAEDAGDGELLARFAERRDEAAFAALVERHGGLVWGLCRRMLGDDHDADDAFQAAFLVLARRVGSIRKRDSVGSWLHAVAYRVACEARVRKARRHAHERQAADMGTNDDFCQRDRNDPSTEAAWRELQPMLDDELSRLPEKYRAPLVLCYLQGKTNEEAARELCWPTGTVKGRLSRARDLLRRRLNRRGIALSVGLLSGILTREAATAAPASVARATVQAAVGGTASLAALSLADRVVKVMYLARVKQIAAALLLTATLLGAGGWAAFHSLAAAPNEPAKEALPAVVRSAQSGAWSAPATWEGGKVPAAGARVQVRAGHAILYDTQSDKVIRSIHVAGTLRFSPDKDTRLDVGLIKIQPGDDASEHGFDCDAHAPVANAPGSPQHTQAALEVGTPQRPIDAGRTALIRLAYIEGHDPQSCPAIVCCGGKMDFHGAPLSRTWLKLGAAAKAGDTQVTLAEPVTGWRVGDRVLLTATTRQNKVKKTFRESTKDSSQTEERIIKAIDGVKLTLDKPLEFDHLCQGEYRGDVANLSRNVIVESADPKTARGHTMYHRSSAGAISYAEFRRLGKEGVLGRYSLHYHLVGDTMRGSYVIGASIWDSGNRWLTIHGTNYLVVRDNVGYQSQGHGFFLEDGTEVRNVLDRNLAVQAYVTRPLPNQVLPFDKNDGSGFWWANCLNSFTRNVAAECDEYGYFFQAVKTPGFDPALPVQQPDGSRKRVDIRTLPFIRFEDNEAHCQRRHAFNLGGGVPFGDGVAGVGPDERHPFVIRNFRSWNVHWAIHPVSPSLLLDGMDIYNAEYGVWRPVYRQHAYRGIAMDQVPDQTRYAFVAGNKPPNAAGDFPKPLDPVDDLPPSTVITHVQQLGERGASVPRVVVRGTTIDNGEVKRVQVNGRDVKPLAANFAQWEITLDAPAGKLELKAHAEDAAGNIEPRPHQLSWPSER